MLSDSDPAYERKPRVGAASTLAFDFRLRLDTAGLGEFCKMRVIAIAAFGAAVLLSGCAFQRAQEAQDARAQMVGMSKEQVLACMGPPVNKAAEAMTEVWAYNSGNGTTVTDASYGRLGGSAISSSRFCNINVVMNKGQVAAAF